MNCKDHPGPRVEDGFFLAFVLIITVAFALVIEPFFAAILWAVVTAILFTPYNQRLLAKMPRRRNGAALITLLCITALVIVPSILLGLALIREISAFYTRIQAGHVDFALIFEQLQARLPDWVRPYADRFGLTDGTEMQAQLNNSLAGIFRTIATQAVAIGQGAFSFVVALGVMLYLTFFLLRDGETLTANLNRVTPLRPAQLAALLEQFVKVVRATIKGSVVVAIVQGFIGGIVFWALSVEGALLWGVLMGFFSLLPAIGTGLIWVPFAIYLFATGAILKGVILVFCGLFVIGMVDNILRPILVGRDTRLPDYVVLITTLGGIELMGFSGIVIGPVIAALFIATWNILATMREPRAHHESAGEGTESGTS